MGVARNGDRIFSVASTVIFGLAEAAQNFSSKFNLRRDVLSEATFIEACLSPINHQINNQPFRRGRLQNGQCTACAQPVFAIFGVGLIRPNLNPIYEGQEAFST